MEGNGDNQGQNALLVCYAHLFSSAEYNTRPGGSISLQEGTKPYLLVTHVTCVTP
jgi:hypothetical protein